MTSLALRPSPTPAPSSCYQLHKAAMGDYITAIWGRDKQVQRGPYARSFNPGRWQIITADGADIGMIDVEYRPAEIYLSRFGSTPPSRPRHRHLPHQRTPRQGQAERPKTWSSRAHRQPPRPGPLPAARPAEVARRGDSNIEITMRSARALR